MAVLDDNIEREASQAQRLSEDSQTASKLETQPASPTLDDDPTPSQTTGPADGETVCSQLRELNMMLTQSRMRVRRAKPNQSPSTPAPEPDTQGKSDVVSPLRRENRLGEKLGTRRPQQRTVDDAEFFDCLSADELSQLSNYLQRIIDNAKTRTDNDKYAERRRAAREYLSLMRLTPKGGQPNE